MRNKPKFNLAAEVESFKQNVFWMLKPAFTIRPVLKADLTQTIQITAKQSVK